MRPPRTSLTQALSSLSLATSRQPPCIRPFSSTSPAQSGPLVRMRRERIATKLKRSRARAADLQASRAARADPIISRKSPFIESLLIPTETLAQPGNAPHSRSEQTQWPQLTNFGLSADDSLTLAIGAKAAELKRIEKERQKKDVVGTSVVQLWKGAAVGEEMEMKMNDVRKRDEQKREVMSRIVDMTNACSKDIAAVNIQNAVRFFARNKRDTGSPEVQIGVMTVRILALSNHLESHRNDKTTKRALNMLVHQRQKMLKYLRRTDPGRYKGVLKSIGLDDIAVVQEVR